MRLPGGRGAGPERGGLSQPTRRSPRPPRARVAVTLQLVCEVVWEDQCGSRWPAGVSPADKTPVGTQRHPQLSEGALETDPRPAQGPAQLRAHNATGHRGALEGTAGKQRQWAVSGLRGELGGPQPTTRLATSLCCLHRVGGPCLLSTQGPKPRGRRGRGRGTAWEATGAHGPTNPQPPSPVPGPRPLLPAAPSPTAARSRPGPSTSCPTGRRGQLQGRKGEGPRAKAAGGLQSGQSGCQERPCPPAPGTGNVLPGHLLLRGFRGRPGPPASSGLVPPAGAGTEPTAWRKPPSLGCQTEPRAGGARGPGPAAPPPSTEPLPRGAWTDRVPGCAPRAGSWARAGWARAWAQPPALQGPGR